MSRVLLKGSSSVKTRIGNQSTRRKFLGAGAVGAVMAVSVPRSKALPAAKSGDGKLLTTINMTNTLNLNRNKLHQLHKIWDEAHVLAALQGLANRNNATIYQFFLLAVKPQASITSGGSGCGGHTTGWAALRCNRQKPCAI